MTKPDESSELPWMSVPFDEKVLDMLHKIRDHYWDRSNQALAAHDVDAFQAWNRRAKQVGNVITTAQEIRIRDREAWAAEQTARLQAQQASNGKALTNDA